MLRMCLVAVAAASLAIPSGRAQVFVVGEKTATADLPTDFTPTDLVLPQGKLSERGRRELVRDLDAEQGFAHRALPLGAGLTLKANGPLAQSAEEYRKMIFSKGEACAPGDRVLITALEIKGDRIQIDFNGGPYEKHRFLKHIQLNDAPVTQDTGQRVTGSRVTLVFPGGVPEVSAPEVKALLQPLVDFGVKSGVQAYADTLPAPVKRAIAQHDVLVGMDHRMVLAALGAPESKVREHTESDPSQARYEEWIYGQVPKTVKFIRFTGDKVTQVKIAAMGKPIEIRDKDEMAAYMPAEAPHEVLMGDARSEADEGRKTPPTLHRDGDAPATVPSSVGKVQYPVPSQTGAPTTADPSGQTVAHLR